MCWRCWSQNWLVGSSFHPPENTRSECWIWAFVVTTFKFSFWSLKCKSIGLCSFFYFGESNTHHCHLGSNLAISDLTGSAVTKIKSMAPWESSASNVKGARGYWGPSPQVYSSDKHLLGEIRFTWLPLRSVFSWAEPRRPNSWPSWGVFCCYVSIWEWQTLPRPCDLILTTPPLPPGTGHFSLNGIMCHMW